MPFLNDAQGSEAWLAARRGVVTGSRFAEARDRSSGLTAQQAKYVTVMRETGDAAEAMKQAGYKKAPTSESVAYAVQNGIQMQWNAPAIAYAQDLAREIMGGTVPPIFQNAAMKTGTEQEPFARAAYEGKTGIMVEEVGLFVTDDGRFGCSADGLCGDDGVLEVKTMVGTETLFKAVAYGDISAYRDQCLAYLWLLGRKWVDLVLWMPDLNEMVIRRIERDDDEIQALEDDLMAFLALVDEKVVKLQSALSGKP